MSTSYSPPGSPLKTSVALMSYMTSSLMSAPSDLLRESQMNPGRCFSGKVLMLGCCNGVLTNEFLSSSLQKNALPYFGEREKEYQLLTLPHTYVGRRFRACIGEHQRRWQPLPQ